MANKYVLVPVANGTEELEAVTVIDTLRRAGAKVTVASVEPELVVKCSRGVTIQADELLRTCANSTYDLIVLPGGMPGATNLANSTELDRLLKDQAKSEGKLVGAICAAPAVVLESKGLLEGVKATGYPSIKLKNGAVEENVVIDGGIITSRGPGTALQFALALVQALFGEEKRREVGDKMLAKF